MHIYQMGWIHFLHFMVLRGSSEPFLRLRGHVLIALRFIIVAWAG